MLFAPGNDPARIVEAGESGADCVIYDLEDSVSIFEKDSARTLVKYVLRSRRPGCHVGIRVNSADSPYHEDDVRTLVPLKPDFLRLPKAESAGDVTRLDALMASVEREAGVPVGTVRIMASIESARGVLNALQIASASSRVLAIGFGAEDFRTDMGLERSADGSELTFARNMVALSARAAGVLALDYIYPDIGDDEGFRADVWRGRGMGYTGKSVIDAAQVAVVNEVYTPSAQAVADARRVLSAWQENLKDPSHAALNGRVIDKPMVTAAMAVLSQARAAGVRL